MDAQRALEFLMNTPKDFFADTEEVSVLFDSVEEELGFLGDILEVAKIHSDINENSNRHLFLGEFGSVEELLDGEPCEKDGHFASIGGRIWVYKGCGWVDSGLSFREDLSWLDSYGLFERWSANVKRGERGVMHFNFKERTIRRTTTVPENCTPFSYSNIKNAIELVEGQEAECILPVFDLWEE